MSCEESPGPVVAPAGAGPALTWQQHSQSFQVHPHLCTLSFPWDKHPSTCINWQGEQQHRLLWLSQGALQCQHHISAPFLHLKTQLSLNSDTADTTRTLGRLDGWCCIPGAGKCRTCSTFTAASPFPSSLSIVFTAGNKGEAEHWHWCFLAQRENNILRAFISLRFPPCHFS